MISSAHLSAMRSSSARMARPWSPLTKQTSSSSDKGTSLIATHTGVTFVGPPILIDNDATYK